MRQLSVKMSIFIKLIYKFNAIPIKTAIKFFIHFDKLILKSIQGNKALKLKCLGKKKKKTTRNKEVLFH